MKTHLTPIERIWFIRDLPLVVLQGACKFVSPPTPTPSSCKLVLLVLSSHCGKAPSCYPNLATLADHTGLSQKTIRQALKALQGAHLVQTLRRYRKSTLYTLTFESYAVNLVTLCGRDDLREVKEEDVQLLHAMRYAVVTTVLNENETIN